MVRMDTKAKAGVWVLLTLQWVRKEPAGLRNPTASSSAPHLFAGEKCRECHRSLEGVRARDGEGDPCRPQRGAADPCPGHCPRGHRGGGR